MIWKEKKTISIIGIYQAIYPNCKKQKGKNNQFNVYDMKQKTLE